MALSKYVGRIYSMPMDAASYQYILLGYNHKSEILYNIQPNLKILEVSCNRKNIVSYRNFKLKKKKNPTVYRNEPELLYTFDSGKVYAALYGNICLFLEYYTSHNLKNTVNNQYSRRTVILISV